MKLYSIIQNKAYGYDYPIPATLQDLRQAAKEFGCVVVPMEPNYALLDEYRELHWQLRGIQLCDEDYREMHKVMLKAAEAAE